MAAEKSSIALEAMETSAYNHSMEPSLEEKPSIIENISESVVENHNIVKFGEDDPDNPTQWPLWQKWSIVLLVATMFMLTNIGTIIIVPAVPQVLDEFNTNDGLYSTILVSIWELGEGFGPFLVGPLSETYGRMPIYHAGNLLFIICSVASALSTNISMLVAFRFLNGFVITSSTLGPSIIGDLFHSENRGKAMALAISLPLIGPFVAPIMGSVIAASLGWRWTIWIVVIAVGAITCLSFVVFRETYPSKILEQRAERMRRETGNLSPYSKHENKGNNSFVKSMTRPMRILFRSPIVFIISFYTALTYGLSYLILTTLTQVMEENYGFNEGNVGYLFLGRAVGNIVGMILYGMVSDRYMEYKKAKTGASKPENRLLLMVFGSVALPLGLFLYGWTAERHVHWIVPIVGIAIVGFSMLLTILPTENYLVDVYELHGASAVAAGVILRAMFGALFPLAGPPMYSKLGLGWGNSIFAFIAVGFVPVLFFLMRYGEFVRKSRRFQQEL
ncbi:hypothetical protein HYFRA_00000566 [Hymenoscyphus fraxineus]|uniref:Major facilitator superfamily (MFS) profile domain-containing protein n=1 Tax=Hymenoscyphus fraxineus TaxID=746836 RepID=A0A9N9L500_9HELO|nr:hypothetical protein HYFRA_00000566 [Hymenoscyphus fraxineus]